MNWYLVAGVVLFILIVGSLIALVWWNLAAKMAPYDDERGTRGKRRNRARDTGHGDNSVIVPWMIGSALSDAAHRPGEQHPHGSLSDSPDNRRHDASNGRHESSTSDRAERDTSSWNDAPSWNESGGGSDSGGSDSGGGGDSGGSSD